MNAESRTPWLIALMVILLVTCNQFTEPEEEISVKISDVRNMVWTLEGFEIGGQSQDPSSYEPFHLVYGDSLFHGDDGCNNYGGVYEVQKDRVFPGDWWMTEMACPSIQTFSVDHLIEPYRYGIQIDENELVISSGDSIYTYRSDHLKDVDSLLLDREWVLNSASAPGLDELVGRGLQITLEFDSERGFEAEWVCGTSKYYYGCGEIRGLYGIGNSHSILFYETGSGGRGVQWREYLNRILSSSFYQVSDTLLVLEDSGGTETFEFTADLSLVGQTDKLTYAPFDLIEIHISNRTDSTLYFIHCGEQIAYYLQQYEEGYWKETRSRGIICLAIYSSGAIPVESDSSYVGRAIVRETGQFRFLFPFRWDYGDPVWTGWLLSNEFTVE